jgi:hypothetical protein
MKKRKNVKRSSMAQIPTAEELLSKRVYINREGVDSVDDTVSDVTATMIEFAKIHVENFANSFNLSTDYRKHLVENYIKNIE